MTSDLAVAAVAPLSDAVPGALSYRIPAELRERVKPGVAVIVPLRKKQVAGIVVGVGPLTERPEFQLKSIESVVDEKPALTAAQLKLARWMSQEYHAALGRCCALMVPPGLTPKSAKVYALADDRRPTTDDGRSLSSAVRIVDILHRRGPLVESRLKAALRGVGGWRPALKQLIDQGTVVESSTMQATLTRAVRTTMAQLAISAETLDIVLGNFDEEATAHPRSASALRRRAGALVYLLQRNGFAWADWIMAETGANRADLTWLAERDYILLGDAERWRDPLADVDYIVKTPPLLTDDQQRAWDAIRLHSALSTPDSTLRTQHFLLRGVTGSGKTEVYMRAVDLALQQGRGAIVLVPEISLTPQTARRFLERFPAKVALIHSRLKPGERYDTWRRIRSGELPVVVGARSALFAPLRDVGVIVIDEEHDQSYKQGSPPYYHTRNVAMTYARLNNAALIMGSATPSLEAWWMSSTPLSPQGRGGGGEGEGRIKVLELPNRVRGHVNRIGDQQARLGVKAAHQPETDAVAYQPLPDVQVVDMRAELRGGNISMFSGALQLALAETLQRGEQAILFLNRRGSASCVICRDCGFAVRCPNDDVPLTYHQESMKEEGGRMKASSSFILHPSSLLKCHYCDHVEPVPAACPSCGSGRIRFIGIGTQRVEQAVREQFPKARVVRWDRDASSGRTSADQMLQRFVNQQADVLVGTQMIAKGLDLPLVTTVGVVLADVGLFLPDFRASERVFDLIEQVAGRAGRGLLAGRVVVQTYNPDHPAVAFAARHDVAGFAKYELAQRQALNLPPYTRLVRFEVAHEDNARARLECEMLARQLRRRVPELTDVIGPAQAYFARMRNRYRWHVLVRTPSPRKLLEGLDVPGDFVVDVDPVSVL